MIVGCFYSGLCLAQDPIARVQEFKSHGQDYSMIEITNFKERSKKPDVRHVIATFDLLDHLQDWVKDQNGQRRGEVDSTNKLSRHAAHILGTYPFFYGHPDERRSERQFSPAPWDWELKTKRQDLVETNNKTLIVTQQNDLSHIVASLRIVESPSARRNYFRNLQNYMNVPSAKEADAIDERDRAEGRRYFEIENYVNDRNSPDALRIFVDHIVRHDLFELSRNRPGDQTTLLVNCDGTMRSIYIAMGFEPEWSIEGVHGLRMNARDFEERLNRFLRGEIQGQHYLDSRELKLVRIYLRSRSSKLSLVMNSTAEAQEPQRLRLTKYRGKLTPSPRRARGVGFTSCRNNFRFHIPFY